MQDDAHYGSANVVLYDAAPANRSSMRAALGAVGFRQIFASSDFDEVARAVTKESCDVLVADLSVEPERICKMMRDVRHGDVSPNPFIVALLTTWGVRAEDANNIMGSGADDVLVRPFSVSFLAERVRALVDARKEFVVTADYVGPNRRKTDDRADHVRLLDVPNTLRLKAKPEEAGGKGIDIASAVREARSKIGEMRLVGSALQLRLLAHFALQAAKDNAALEKYVAPMSAISRLLFDKLNGMSDGALESASEALLEASAAAMQGENVIASLEASGRHAKLIHQRLSPRREESDLEQEFALAVKRLTQRMTQSVLEAVAVG